MQLTVRDVANLIRVSEKTIYRWVKAGQIPAYRIGEQFRFNRFEILEWATARKINISQGIVLADESGAGPLPGLGEALQNGGISYLVGGKDRSTALKCVVDCLRLPAGTDKESFFRILLAREKLASTGVGDGIAIPHVRTPIILHIDIPQLALCFLEKPVEFGALDGNPVYALFTLICPTIKSHLHLLSRLAFALRDPAFKKAIEKRALRDEILRQTARVEKRLSQGGDS